MYKRRKEQKKERPKYIQTRHLRGSIYEKESKRKTPESPSIYPNVRAHLPNSSPARAYPERKKKASLRRHLHLYLSPIKKEKERIRLSPSP